MTDRPYDAVLFDLDGTLLNEHEVVAPANLAAVHALREQGVQVLFATGRSVESTRPVVEEVGLTGPIVTFNGAVVWDYTEDRPIEERVLSQKTVDACHDYRRTHEHMTLVMSTKNRYCLDPPDDHHRNALHGLSGIEFVDEATLEAEECIVRFTFLADRGTDSEAYAAHIEEHVGRPVYTTHFPLSILVRHRNSPFVVVDVHPPMLGKAEALRYLHDHHGIPPARVVAFGDAGNDVPMLRKAGLGVAMGNAEADVQAVADRVVGDHTTTAIADTLRELFPI
jgi:Cof subfamily protein (haloacid dehalogenase superfamily)